MTDLPAARAVRRPPLGRTGYDCVPLAHHERTLRRRRLFTVHGEGFLADLPETTRVHHGDAFELLDGRLIDVVAAEERVLVARGPDLARLAWHIGNRHAPCAVWPDRLLVLDDPVMARMLEGLGAEVTRSSLPFEPEGGAYEGATHGHGDGHDAHDH